MISLIHGIEQITQMKYVQNRNKLTEIGSKLVSTKEEDRKGQDQIGAWD